MDNESSSPRTLLYDVESFPNIGYTWGKWEQNVIEFIEERKIVSFAWKWLGESKIDCLALPMYKEYKLNRSNNYPLIKDLHELMGNADIVVAHNIDHFDDKMANADFITHGFPPPPPHKTVNTLKVAKSKFNFNSNKLDDLGVRLGVGRKLSTGGFQLWKDCMAGDVDAWGRMVKYNKQDVSLLEKVYLKLRPWITNHPQLPFADKCPICNSSNIISRGHALTKTGPRKRMSCKECESWFSCKG